MDKKEELLLGIAELFYQKGYDKTSIRDISRELNISKPGLYFYFDNKQQMLYDLAYDFMAKSNDYLKSALAPISDPKQKLFLIIQSHITYFVQHPAQIKVVIYEAHSLEGEYQENFRVLENEYIEIIKGVLSNLISDAGIEMNLNIATFTLLGTLNWIIKWYKPEKTVNPESLIREIWTFFLNGLGLK